MRLKQRATFERRPVTAVARALPLPGRGAPLALLTSIGFALLMAAVVSQGLPAVLGV